MSKVSNFLVLTTDESTPWCRNGWTVIGRLSELTDKDCEEFVELTPTGLFKLYSWSEEKVDNLGIQPMTNFAKESFMSRIKYAGVDVSDDDFIVKLYD